MFGSAESLIEYQTGTVASRALLKRKTGNVTLFAFDAGEGLSEHTTPFDALIVGVDGTARVVIGGAEHMVNRGDLLLLPAGIPHAVQANERFKMLLVMIRE